MKIAVAAETRPGERRVALVPDLLPRLTGLGWQVAVEPGAGVAAGFADDTYRSFGAVVDAKALTGAGVVLSVRPLTARQVRGLTSGAVTVSFLPAARELDLVRVLRDGGHTALAMELVPRISRAQSVDALSSQAFVAGYRAVSVAVERLPRFFPLSMTASGTIPPAKVLVLGAGVAGLQAIATARRLGAVVQGFDIRPEVKEQVESLGANWVGIQMEEAVGSGGYAKEVSEEAKQREHEHLHRLVADADVVITTAQIPGRPAPVLITAEMVDAMRPGAVIVDLAAESGGNCAFTRPDQEIQHDGVTILGPVELSATLPLHASQMYSRNIVALLQHLVKDGELHIDPEDEISRGCMVTHAGKVTNERVKAMAGVT